MTHYCMQEPVWLHIDDHNMADITVNDVLAQPAYACP